MLNIDKDDLQLSIDLETCGLQPNAVVLTIGWCAFRFDGSIVAAGTLYPSIGEQLAIGRTIELDTIDWWRKQNGSALCAAFDNQRQPLPTTLGELAGMTTDVYGVWGFGSEFDNIKVSSLGQQCGVNPWSHRQSMCGRTLIGLAGKDFKWPSNQGTAHNAKDDAINQARAYIEAYHVISGGAA